MQARTRKVTSDTRAAPYRVAVVHTASVMLKSPAIAAKEMNKKSGMRASSLGNAMPMPITMKMQPTAVKTSGSFRRKVDMIQWVFCSGIGLIRANWKAGYSPHRP
jgi:hypothetical protein